MNSQTLTLIGDKAESKRILIEPWAYEVHLTEGKAIQLVVEGSLDIYWHGDCLQVYPANDCKCITLMRDGAVVEVFE